MQLPGSRPFSMLAISSIAPSLARISHCYQKQNYKVRKHIPWSPQAKQALIQFCVEGLDSDFEL